MNKIISPLLAISIATFFSACGGSGDEKKSTLIANAPQNRSLSGVAQKGPAIKGGLVYIYELDHHANRTGKKLLSLINNNEGGFSLSIPDSWGQFVEVVFNGRYISEAIGEISAPVQLSAIQDSKSSQQVSVNILTTIATARVKSLPKNIDSDSLERMLQNAYQSLEAITGISAKEIPRLNLLGSGNSQARASMLLLSGALLEVAASQNTSVQRVIDQLAIDFALDGVFDGNGDNWLRAIQALVHNTEQGYLEKYSRSLKQLNLSEKKLPKENSLPRIVAFSARPTAVATIIEKKVICAEDVIPLSGDGSIDSDNGNNIRYSWFQTDHTGITTVLSSPFSKNTSFIAPAVSQAITLFFTLLVVDEKHDEQGNTLDISDVETIEVTVLPKENSECRDKPPAEEVVEPLPPEPLPPPPVIIQVPTAQDVLVDVAKGGSINVDLAGKFSNPAGVGLEFSIIAGPSFGTASISNQIITYEHNNDATSQDALAYKIKELSGGLREATAVVRFNITQPTASNTAPIIVIAGDGTTIPAPDTLNVTFDENAVGVVFNVDSTDDSDAEEAGLTYSFAGGEDDDVFTLNSNTGELKFENPPDYENGEDADNDSIYKTKVKVTDSGGLIDTQNIHITVNDISNSNPIAEDDSFNVSPGSAGLSVSLQANVLNDNGNGGDSDPEGDPLTVLQGTGPQTGTLTLNADGTFTYQPTQNYDSQLGDSFTYILSDGNSESDDVVGTVTITGTGYFSQNIE